MPLRVYLVLVGVATTLSWIAWFLVLGFLNPFSTGILGFVFFYTSLFMALLGTFSLIGFMVRFLFKKEEILYRQMRVSFRQSVLLAALVVIVLLLQSQRYLLWWNVLVLVGLVSLVELFFLSYKKFDVVR